MTGAKIKGILKSRGLRITDCRIDVMKHFQNHKGALSQGDLEVSLKGYDRVTLYRTLNSFLESGLLHKIPNESGKATFGLCSDSCSSEKHQDNHMHFKCNKCGQMECLDDREVPIVSVPSGYKMERINLIIDGICADCA